MCGKQDNRSDDVDESVAVFWLQLAASLFVLSLVAVWYVWPAIAKLPRHSALVPLLFVHVPRYVGMTLLVPGMVDPKLPIEFLSSAAYGDLLEAALALASIYALRSDWRSAIPLAWVTNTWGFLDLLNGVRGVLQLNVPSFNLATAWYIYTLYAPLVVVSHVTIFVVLVKSKSWKQQRFEICTDWLNQLLRVPIRSARTLRPLSAIRSARTLHHGRSVRSMTARGTATVFVRFRNSGISATAMWTAPLR